MKEVRNGERVRLCFISYSHLSRLVMEVAPEYAAVAEIDIIDAAFEPALERARARERQGSVHAFVSAGSNAALLRNALTTPVATIKPSGYDMLAALLKARETSRRVGVVTYGETIAELDDVRDLLDLEVAQRAYRTREEARECFRALAAEAYPVIVGSSIAVEQAEQCGLLGILAYSLESVREGIETALDLARIARLKAARYEQLIGVLHNLKEAVLAVDRSGRIITLNSPMEAALGHDRHDLIAKLLDEVAPELSLAETLASGRDDQQRVCQIGQREWLMNRTPIRERDAVVGAIVTLYDAAVIQEADTILRSQRKSRQYPQARWKFRDLQGDSPCFVRARETAMRFARTDLTVLITGESGTGKELFAQSIHDASVRSRRPFVAVNCAAVPENLLESELFGHEEGSFSGSRKGGKRGLVEAAHTGTLFLDEIGDMPMLLQTRLLRVLQEREVMRVGGLMPLPVDVRVLAATHQPLDDLVAQRRFRADLYYRLNILRLTLPPLRERASDVDAMARGITARCLRRLGSAQDAHTLLGPLYARLRAYRWGGNVRELENLCERMAVYFAQFAGSAQVDYAGLAHDCPELFAASLVTAGDPDAEDQQLAEVLAACGGNRKEAARRLGISRSTLWRRLKDSPPP
jgi:propionate catabolism operon transcriptional regulator